MFRGFVHKYMPGLASFIRYDRSWLFSDMGAGLSVAAIAAAESPVQWLVIDASSINVVDITAVQKFDELREELAAQGIKLVSARVKQNLLKYFKPAWGAERMETSANYRYDTLKSAVRAFNNRVVLEEANGPDSN